MEKITMKEKVLRFVEAKGTTSFTDIQRFIVDCKYGAGTYDAAAGTDLTWGGGDFTKKVNPYRGYYCGAFSKTGGAYFLKGKDRLEKMSNGKYRVARATQA